MNTVFDVVIIGAGPVGIAAAAHAKNNGLVPLVLEKGVTVGNAIKEWGHVRLFTKWSYLIDKEVEKILNHQGWKMPNLDEAPTGKELVDQYLAPAANAVELSKYIRYNAEVIAIAKEGHSKHTTQDRNEKNFVIHYRDAEQDVHIIHSKAVIDASGTWSSPNPIGRDGLPVPGETKNSDAIAYGIPDVLDKARDDYQGKTTLLIGGGHSAINVGLNLIALQNSAPDTKIYWGLRGENLDKLLGSGINDKVPARLKLGRAAQSAIDSGKLTLLSDLNVKQISREAEGLKVSLTSSGCGSHIYVDKIIVATGFKPDLHMLREIRLNLDEVVEAPRGIASMVDPNAHNCGSVPGHGAKELVHIDNNFYIVGMKSYGRAPSFLMLHGYEQVRSITAKLAGDEMSANEIRLTFPDSVTNKQSCC
ncbi:NAD(P)-binding domain-containing protein [Pseudoalteromonas sp. McH1-7]|uniref:NAD(P)-binding domain-containing protein n=1 Tax=Pseudoalteromonas sp. McH1-7 TaxID=2745574 RepID=UPI0015920B0D|nr:NAD(P)-binding domain-containing protein [Pseudoalteromonas sp. McH1-7]NUZ10305.1 NAD(P)-binding domain-containing protein [Pseudoalteromonas sp. McH1-7]